MLHEFLAANGTELISRCRSKVAQRSAPKATDEELKYGIPLFLDQLVKTLQVEQTSDPMRSRKVSAPSGGEKPAISEMGKAAVLHGRELLWQGFTIDQVVHDYGDLCQAKEWRIDDIHYNGGSSLKELLEGVYPAKTK